MNFDELKNQWNTSLTQEDPAGDVLRQAQQKAAVFEKESRNRTWIGALMFLLPVPLIAFVIAIYPEKSLISEIAGLLACLFLTACAAVTVVHGRLSIKQNPGAQAVRDFVQRELQRADRQVWLFRQLKWWFWSPLLLGWVAFTAAVLMGVVNTNLFSVSNLFLLPFLAYFGIRSSQRYLEREILPWQQAFREGLDTLNGA